MRFTSVFFSSSVLSSFGQFMGLGLVTTHVTSERYLRHEARSAPGGVGITNGLLAATSVTAGPIVLNFGLCLAA